MRAIIVVTLGIAVCAGAERAWAQEIAAEQLFVEGRALMQQERYEAACPKLQASMDLDPASGTQINLAWCYEKLGKLATAWSHYREASDRAVLDGNMERARVARKLAAELEPRLPRLIIAVRAPAPPGLVVHRDGAPVAAALFGAAVYVDPGQHEVSASAPGRAPFSATVTIAEAATSTVEIPELAPGAPDASPPQAPATTGPDAPASPARVPAAGPLFGAARIDAARARPGARAGRRRVAGLITGGAGLAGLGLGLGLGASAYRSWNRAFDSGQCERATLQCTVEGLAGVEAARRRARLSSVATGVGLAAVVTGAVLYFTAPRAAEQRRVTRLVPWTGSGAPGVAVAGAFRRLAPRAGPSFGSSMRTLALLGLACTGIGSPGCEQLIGIEPVTLFPDGGSMTGGVPDGAGTTDAAPRTVQQLSLGGGHTCVLWSTGQISCWGTNFHGQLGRGHTHSIGDDEPIAPLAGITLGGAALAMSSNGEHNCALMTTGVVRCWGSNVTSDRCDPEAVTGQLGYPQEVCVGDDELASAGGNVQLGGPALRVATGAHHTCAQVSASGIRCWGRGMSGQLGLGDTQNIGDDERPSSASLVPVTSPGEAVRALVAGQQHTCILLESGHVRCWGSSQYGQLGYGNTDWIGDDEPARAVNVELGGAATQLVAGAYHNCALLATGEVRCWGRSLEGRLGLGPVTLASDPDHVGDDELPADVPPVDVGGEVLAMAASFAHTCVVLTGGQARCWGKGDYGQLGNLALGVIGDDETPASVPTVDIGAPIVHIATGFAHTCALSREGQAFCWGFNGRGQLGYGHTEDLGDDESPRQVGPVPLAAE